MVVAGRKHPEISGIAEISEKLGTLFDFPLQFYPSFWTEIGIGRSASSEHPRTYLENPNAENTNFRHEGTPVCRGVLRAIGLRTGSENSLIPDIEGGLQRASNKRISGISTFGDCQCDGDS